MTWNPEQYLKFAEPRIRPALDLISRIDSDQPQRIFDLGCGTGNVTQLIKARWPEAAITGVDDSAEMLALQKKSLMALLGSSKVSRIGLLKTVRLLT